MAAYVVANVTQSTFYLVMTGICILASLFFLLLRAPLRKGLVVPEDSRENENEQTMCEDIKETYSLIISKRMLKMVPLIMWSALSIAIYSSLFVPLMTDTMKENPDTSRWDE